MWKTITVRLWLIPTAGLRTPQRQIVAASTLSRTAVAHHLRVLREARVLRSRKVGREVWYWPDPCAVRAALDAVGGYLQTHFRSESEPPMRATSARPSAARRSRR